VLLRSSIRDNTGVFKYRQPHCTHTLSLSLLFQRERPKHEDRDQKGNIKECERVRDDSGHKRMMYGTSTPSRASSDFGCEEQ
jgi:hypothetical protein